MSPLLRFTRSAGSFAGREWKFLICFLLAAQFAWAVERFLEKSAIDICIGYWHCRR